MAKIVFLQSAVNDIESARDWYDEKYPGLGESFLNVVVKAVETIQVSPKAFPIVIFYRFENSKPIQIHSCLHYMQNIHSILEQR